MLHKTQGIVFKYVKYRESSIIVNIFTEQFGLQSYIVNGARSKSSKGKIALYQPLTCLELVVYNKEGATINRISEVKCSHPFASIPIEIGKSSIALFLTEVLHKIIREQHDTHALFTFIQQAILILDHIKTNYANFHIQFLLKLTMYLGFGVSDNNELKTVINFNDRDFELLKQLNVNAFDKHISINNTDRSKLLSAVLYYYKQHYPSLSDIKSLSVLNEVLHS